jgi:hypothetical protein
MFEIRVECRVMTKIARARAPSRVSDATHAIIGRLRRREKFCVTLSKPRGKVIHFLHIVVFTIQNTLYCS